MPAQRVIGAVAQIDVSYREASDDLVYYFRFVNRMNGRKSIALRGDKPTFCHA